MKEELSKKSAKLIDDYINGRQQLSSSVYKKLRAELNLCIQELQDLTWNMTCDPSQYDKLKKRLEQYKNFENTMIYVHRFHKELNGDKQRREFYKAGTQDQEELPIMKMKLIKVTKKDSKVKDADFYRCRNLIHGASKHISDAAMEMGEVLGSAKEMDLHEAEGLLDDADYYKIENNIDVCVKMFKKMKKALEAAR